jgi:hypothetical protein
VSLYSEPGSLVGTAAAACVGQALYPKPKVPNRARRRDTKVVVSPPLAEDALDETGCARCGVAGIIHPSPAECIDTLRDLIAELSEDPLIARKVKAAPAPGAKRGRFHMLRVRING